MLTFWDNVVCLALSILAAVVPGVLLTGCIIYIRYRRMRAFREQSGISHRGRRHEAAAAASHIFLRRRQLYLCDCVTTESHIRPSPSESYFDKSFSEIDTSPMRDINEKLTS